MARLLVHLERAELVEAQAAARTLLAHPLVTGSFPDPHALALVRTHEEPLREEMLRLLGYRLDVGPSWARLVRRPSRLSPGRPAVTRGGRPFNRRSYATLCLVLAALEQLGAAVLVTTLVDEVNRQAAGEALLAVDPTHHEHRRAVVDAVLYLQDRGVLRLVEGDAERWKVDGESDALFHVDLDAAARILIAWPSVLEATGDPAVLLVEHHAPTEDGASEALRHRVHRRIIEQATFCYEDLDDDELAYVRQRRSRFSEQLSRLTGCVLEARAEGVALVDVEDRPLGDRTFPGGGTVAWAALLLGERLVAAVSGLSGPVRHLDGAGVAAAWADVVEEYGPRFRKDWRDDTDGLLGACVTLLAVHDLVVPLPGGGMAVSAPLARYRADVRRPSERQGALL